MSNAPHARPRRIATVGRITVVVGSGIALGALSAHVQSEALAKVSSDGTTQAVQDVKPQVVTIVRKKHVRSDPIIVYRQVPSDGDDTSGYTSPGNTTSTNLGTSRSFNPAPAPAPAANPPAATSTAS